MPIIKLGGPRKNFHPKLWASEPPSLRTTALDQWWPGIVIQGPYLKNKFDEGRRKYLTLFYFLCHFKCFLSQLMKILA
jgi:hypothetical protein